MDTQSQEKGTGAPDPGSTSGAGVGAGAEGGHFECNICLDLAQDPVITLCGHLFCWPCLYRWLQQSLNCKECPVCKAGVSEDKVIPLYGRGMGARDPRRKPVPGPEIPSRPQGQRPEAVRQPNAQFPPGHHHHHGFNFFAGGAAGPFVGAQFGNFTLSAGFGLFPSLFGLQYQAMPMGGEGMGMGNNGGPGGGGAGGGMGGVQAPRGPGQAVPVEVQQQQYLSRLLLLLGTFVVICLVFF